ncbi:DUF4157 domain-containing protein [Nonomuraea jiangxiensis]|uniref:eCIS core domain-containing protein n=1 Tax=Nonomuraea jiangxiensis TaxID=633440 RepID=A0A1G9P9Q1_9ACTN|nr:DUF4157 domain-containing protein [Nonomuraea jiangxiensis]SDL95602.1 protein of unknown function [Nonomuraea jiangxiensis]
MQGGPTLGERLAAQARALRARRRPVFGWTAALAPALARGGALPAPDRSPRRRVEVRLPPVHEPGPQDLAWPRPPAAPPPAPAAPQPVRADLRERLAPVIGPGTERLRIHHGEHADRLAAAHGADAVTVGEEIYFRSGRFRPDQPEGFALLVHEAWHATEPGRPGGAAHRATAWGMAAEENAALSRERAFLDGPAGVPSPPIGAPRPAVPPVHPPAGPAPARPVAVPGTPGAPSAPAARPMAARPDRHQETSAEVLDPGALRQVVREVLRDEAARQIRADLAIELERGA